MKHIPKQLLAMLLALLGCCLSVSAHDFEAVNGDGVKIYYNILSDNTCSVTFKGNNATEYKVYSGNVVIPSFVEYNGNTYTVTSIGKEAFYDCYYLKSISIPKTIETIGKGAFSGVDGLSFANIEDLSSWCKIDFDGYYANPIVSSNSSQYRKGAKLYLNNDPITDLVIPSDIKEIKPYAFELAVNIKTVTLHSEIQSIGYEAFYCSGLIAIDIPYGVERIDKYAFQGCEELAFVTIAESVTSIGEQAFCQCRSLASIDLPNSISVIEAGLFSNCSNLAQVKIPNTISSIKNRAFNGCSNLKTITSLNTICPDLGTDAFYGVSTTDCVLQVPASAVNAYKAAEGWKEFTNIVAIDEPNPECTLSIADQRVRSGQEVLVPVVMENTEYIYGIQCDVSLSSADLAVATDSNGEYKFTWNAERVDGQTASSKLQDGGAVRLVAADYSATKPYKGRDGELFYIHVQVPEGLNGEYTISLSNITLSTYDCKVVCPDASGKIEVFTYTVSDVDCNDKIDESDIESTVQMVLDNAYSTAADMDADNAVDVRDVVEVAKCAADPDVASGAVVPQPVEPNVIVDANTLLTVGDVRVKAGSEAVIPVMMANTDAIYALQCDIKLSTDKLAVATDANGEYVLTWNSERANGQRAAAKLQSSGAVRVVGVDCSAKNPYKGNSGELFYIHVQVPEELCGEFTVSLSNVVLATYNGKVVCPDASGKLTTYTYILGDVDDDDVIDIQDVVETVKLVLNNGYKVAADMDCDGVIDVHDVVEVAKLVLQQGNAQGSKSAPARAQAKDGDAIVVDEVTVAAGSECSMGIALCNDGEYLGFQMDISLPEGFAFKVNGSGMADIAANAERLGGYTLNSVVRADGSLRVIGYSAGAKAIRGSEGCLFTVRVVADNDVALGSHELTLSNIVMAQDSGKAVLGSTSGIISVVNQATGIIGAEASPADNSVKAVYSICGQAMSAPRKGMNIVVGSDGTAKKVMRK